MINLENRIERDELIDDYFNKGLECNIKEVYQAVVNTVADLEYANDEKINEIERLNNIINECAEDILKELEENQHLSYGVALSIRQKLLDYKELKGSDKE